MFGWDAAKDNCTKNANNITTNLVTIISAHPLETRDTAGGDPFGYEDVAGVVEAGVVGMDEFTVNPCLSVAAINTFLFHDAFPRHGEVAVHDLLEPAEVDARGMGVRAGRAIGARGERATPLAFLGLRSRLCCGP